MKLALGLACLASMSFSAASAQETIRTNANGAGPPPGERAQALALDDADAALPAAPPAGQVGPAQSDDRLGAAAPSRDCGPPTDGKPHGEAWAGIGTGGYRNVGGVVTLPVGRCGSLTLAIDHSQWR